MISVGGVFTIAGGIVVGFLGIAAVIGFLSAVANVMSNPEARETTWLVARALFLVALALVLAGLALFTNVLRHP